jgi:myo-inositol 2-dehydrogenase / D-chiro-inositol 1-dehydrogenase
MKMQKVRFGVLGAGRIGRIHAANLAQRVAGAEVAALADTDADAVRRLAEPLGIERTFPDYRAVLESPDVDAIAICTPTTTHHEIIVAAAERGKQIFCEKPIDLDVGKIRSSIEAAGRHSVELMVGFNRRFDPDFRAVHEAIRAGRIGDPHVLRITSRDPGPPPEAYIRLSGGLFLDMTIHDFDMVRYLMASEVTEVYAKAAVRVDPVFERAGDWDTAVVTLTFANGAYATIDNSRKAVYGYDQRVEMFGSGGMLTVTNRTVDHHVYADDAGVHTAVPLNFFMERYAESYVREMQAFVDALREGRAAPVTGNDGLAAVLIALAAGRSARENRPVAL